MADLDQVRKRLANLRAQVATALMVDGAARVAGAVVGCVALSFLLDRVFKLEVVARVVILLAAVGAVGYVVWRYLTSRLKNVPGEDPLAIAVEARFPELKDRLISAIQLSRETDPERYGMSPQLIGEVVTDAIEPVSKVRFRDVLAKRRLAKVVLLGVLGVFALVAWGATDPESSSIWFRRNVLLQNVRWPQRTYLRIDPERFPGGVARIVRGADIVVTALSIGEVHPERVTIFFLDTEGARGKATMKADLEQHTYRHEFQEVAFPITFHLEGGDEVTDEFRVDLMEAPEAEDVEVEVSFPDYADRAPVLVDLSLGDPEMLREGSVTIRGRSTKPLERAEIVLGDAEDKTVVAEKIGDDRFEVTLRPEKTTMAGVRLHDTDGLVNPTLAPRFLIRVVPDRAPKVRLRLRGIGTMVVPVASIPYEVRMRDDVKIVAGRLETKKAAGGEEATEPFVLPFDPESLGSDLLERRGVFELAQMEVYPGAFLTLTVYARDNAPEPHEAKSDPVSLKVVSMEELLQDLLRRQQEQRHEFEALIKREKRLRDRFNDLRDTPPSAPAEVTSHLESQGREQRQIGRRVRSIGRAMNQILDEMVNNHVAEPSRINELRIKVVQGLSNLRKGVMNSQADALDDAARHATEAPLTGTRGEGLDRGYDRVLRAMAKILANMERVELFTEIVESIRILLEEHKIAQREAEARLITELERFFGPGGKPKKDDR
ncbi:MAG: hypothetical protein O7E54_10450 [Planctomycetota bacterium]|nr:hypothetical protein [Planctomycetota bacterium]